MSRDFVIWTGLAGARALNDAVYDVAVREPLIEKTKLLLKLNLINKPKYKSLISMIESPDCENVELADIIYRSLANQLKMSIQFTAATHKYESTDGNPIDWLSVTSFVSLFKKPFDQEGVAAKCAKNKKSKWYGLSPEEIIAIWNGETNRALSLGSWYHDQRESEVLMCDTFERQGIPLPIINIIEQDGVKLSPDQALVPGIYPEHMVYLKSAKLCGQADRVEVIQQTIDLYDYKTNKEIKTKGFTSWDGVTSKMLGPCAHLDDCNFNHYALQLSAYMYIMLKHNHNLMPGKIEIDHIKFVKDGEDKYGYPIVATDQMGDPLVKEVVPYKLPYLKKEIQNMIKYIKLHPEIIKAKKK